MKTSDLIQMSFRNLWRRKSRTILTILSVVIGATAIITMVSLGIGIKESQMEMIDSFVGLDNIEVLNKNQKPVKEAQINKIKNINHVKYVVPYKFISARLYVADNPNYSIFNDIMIIPNDIFKKLTTDMFEKGSNIKENDKNSFIVGSYVTVLEVIESGSSYSEAEVKDYDLLSSKYKLRLGYKPEDGEANSDIFSTYTSQKKAFVDIPFTIKGVLSKESFLPPYGCYINKKTYDYLLFEDQKLQTPTLIDQSGKNKQMSNNKDIYTGLKVIVDDYNNVEYVNAELMNLGYETQSSAQFAEDINEASKKIEIILGGVGSIAFFVSAIGILNTMLMSIYERKKEIGVMKVIGASVADVRNMFLVESSFIGFLGGIVGLILSLFISYIINTFGARLIWSGEETAIKLSSIPLWLALTGVIFSLLVGTLAGYIPAKRATKLSAIETLRGE